MPKMTILILLALTVAITGCAAFQIEGLSLVPSTTLESPRDVLVIRDENVIPRSPIPPDQRTDMSFVIENTDDEKNAKNVVVQLFDAPGFRTLDGALCNSGNSCQPSECTESAKCTSILPGEQKFLSVQMKSPTREQIVGVENKLMLSLKATYEFDASTIYRIPVVNFEEITSRQRAGQTTEIAIPKTISSGPLEADITLQGQQYILSEGDGVFVIKLTDKGSKREGNVKDNKVAAGKMKVTFPEGLTVSDWPKKDEGSSVPAGAEPITEEQESHTSIIDRVLSSSSDSSQTTTTGQKNAFSCPGNVCTNTGDIELFKGESIPLLFRVKAGEPSGPFRSYDVKIEINNYEYELRKSIEVTVKPLNIE